MSDELKKYYLEFYGKISELQPLSKVSVNVDLIQKFVDLCIVDAVNAQEERLENAILSVERKKFLEKQMRYTPIPFRDIFTKEKSTILISGIAGIGKTWLLRKCLLDWSNGLIWNNVEIVFYLECRRLNQYPNISNINELLNIFYKDIVKDFKFSNHTALFIIDGLDEFTYFNELLNPSLICNYPIVKVLEEIQKYKHVIAGRVYAIDLYQSIFTEHSDKLTVQIMGFNENGINNYVENHVMEEKKEVVKTILKESPFAKAMASVPFYLSSMCKIIIDSKKIDENSFLTMTDLYTSLFLYFLQRHVLKTDELIYKIMDCDQNKEYILNICKIAYELFVENKVIFSKEEILTFNGDFDENEDKFFGFIEGIETELGYLYQFAHLSVMEFCASVYAFNCLSSEVIMTNKRLESCLSMIFGLTNKSQSGFLKYFVKLNPLKKNFEKPFQLFFNTDFRRESDDNKLFIECFFESQLPFTDDIISITDQRTWTISIDNKKTPYETACENYFVHHFIKSGKKLWRIRIVKSILNDEEKNLLVQCSANVWTVIFDCPIQFEAWKPKNRIEELAIRISTFLITKNDFEENFLPWISLCNRRISLQLHENIDFIEDVYEWLRCSNIELFEIYYRKNFFYNLDDLKTFIRGGKCLIN